MARICLAIWDIFMAIVRNMGKIRSLPQTGAGLLAFALALAIQSVPAAAQKGSDPISTLFRGPGFTTTPAEPPEWVRKSRPSDDKLYERRQIPAGQPDRAAMSPGDVRRIESELNALRVRHDRAGGRTSAAPPASAAADPRPKKEKSRPDCVLTCNIGLGTINRR